MCARENADLQVVLIGVRGRVHRFVYITAKPQPLEELICCHYKERERVRNETGEQEGGIITQALKA